MTRGEQIMRILRGQGILTSHQIARRMTGGTLEYVKPSQVAVVLWWLSQRGWVVQRDGGWCDARTSGWLP